MCACRAGIQWTTGSSNTDSLVLAQGGEEQRFIEVDHKEKRGYLRYMCIRAAQGANGKVAICRSSLLAKTRPLPGWERKILDGSQIFMAHKTKTRAQTLDNNAWYPMFCHYTRSLRFPYIHILIQAPFREGGHTHRLAPLICTTARLRRGASTPACMPGSI